MKNLVLTFGVVLTTGLISANSASPAAANIVGEIYLINMDSENNQKQGGKSKNDSKQGGNDHKQGGGNDSKQGGGDKHAPKNDHHDKMEIKLKPFKDGSKDDQGGKGKQHDDKGNKDVFRDKNDHGKQDNGHGYKMKNQGSNKSNHGNNGNHTMNKMKHKGPKHHFKHPYTYSSLGVWFAIGPEQGFYVTKNYGQWRSQQARNKHKHYHPVYEYEAIEVRSVLLDRNIFLISQVDNKFIFLRTRLGERRDAGEISVVVYERDVNRIEVLERRRSEIQLSLNVYL